MKRSIIIAIGCFLLTACTGKAPPPSVCDIAASAAPLCRKERSSERISEAVSFTFFVDATDSMRGYVLPGAGTSAYQEMLRTLQDAVTQFNQFSDRTYKFGNQAPVPVERRLHVAASSADFYRDVGGYTQVETVLNDRFAPPAANRLTVVITDLFQKDTDVTGLTRRLKTRYFAKGLAVGVVGIKSAFLGRVYDLDSRGSTSDVRGSRPVYALVVGTYANVAHYFDALKKGSTALGRDGRFVIFTGQPFESRPDFFAGNPLLSERGGGLKSMGFLSGEPTYWFRLREATQSVGFKVCAAGRYRPYVVPFNAGGNWQSSVRLVDAEGRSRLLSLPRPVAVQSDPEACAPGNTEGLGFAVSLDVDGLREPGNYLYVLEYVPTLRNDPDWWDAWNTDDAVTQPLRTLRLRQFLRGLEATALATDRNQAVVMQFYVQK
ncbi:MAG: hypothetical protein H7Y22_14560 [Gemmatimonadaceae bacterium]|nr:hypothetical protein [Gloeobacterales cyanobacterium ES-bin-141]